MAKRSDKRSTAKRPSPKGSGTARSKAKRKRATAATATKSTADRKTHGKKKKAVATKSARKSSAARKTSATRKRGTDRNVTAAAKPDTGRNKGSNQRGNRKIAAETERSVAKSTRRDGKAPSPTSYDPIQFPEERRKMPKTHLSAKELRVFRQMLLDKRAELCGDLENLSSEALNSRGQGSREQSNMPIHMADLGSDNWEREFTLGLLANERALVREIDEALERIDNKTYGICVASHEPIEMARLQAKAWAKYCIQCARAREEGRAS